MNDELIFSLSILVSVVKWLSRGLMGMHFSWARFAALFELQLWLEFFMCDVAGWDLGIASTLVIIFEFDLDEMVC